MKLLIPKQHGAWAMLIIPFFLSMITAGSTIWHIPLFIGWLFLYLATNPLVMLFRKKKKDLYKKWTYIYGGIALLSLMPLLFVQFELLYFGLSMLPLFLINIYYAKQNNERAFINDVVAIISFGIGGLTSYYLGAQQLDPLAWLIFLHSFVFFLGTTFYVKTMIREKKNVNFKYYSWSYHVIVPILIVVLGGSWSAIAYIPSLIRAIILYGKKLPIMKIGIIEIINAVFFFIVLLLYFLWL